MGQTIFIVTSGAYSDYHISSVFSTREKAERYMKELKSECPSIEEYLVDEDDEKISKSAFLTRIDLDSGDVLQQWSYEVLALPNERAPVKQPDITDCRDQPRNSHWNWHGRVTVDITSYVDKEHSLKLAAEFRQSYLRNNSLAHPIPK